VIVPALTFVASANCARYVGATVVFADVREDTLTIDVDHVASLITPRTKAIVAVDYAGLPCDLDELLALADRHGLVLVEDACHAPGALYRGRKVGSIAHLSTFSFHPVKSLTTGEGGMVTTNDAELAARVRQLRNHGINSDFRQREARGTWAYDMVELGFNYRLSDINCALGASQVAKLPGWVQRRQELAARYDRSCRFRRGGPHPGRAGGPDLRLAPVPGADPDRRPQRPRGSRRSTICGPTASASTSTTCRSTCTARTGMPATNRAVPGRGGRLRRPAVPADVARADRGGPGPGGRAAGRGARSRSRPVAEPPAGPSVAVIPARGGSKRIPRKNVRPFLGVPLIVRTLKVVQASGCSTGWSFPPTTTRSPRLARDAGAEVPFRRHPSCRTTTPAHAR
jgi:hypothetical protein